MIAVRCGQPLHLDAKHALAFKTLGAESHRVSAAKLHEGAAHRRVKEGRDRCTLAFLSRFYPQRLPAGAVRREILLLSRKCRSACNRRPPSALSVSRLLYVNKNKIADVRRGRRLGERDLNACVLACRSALKYLTSRSLSASRKIFVVRPVEESGWPCAIPVFIGAGSYCRCLALENRLPGLALKAGVAEDKIAQHLAGIVKRLSAQIDAKSLYSCMQHLRPEGDSRHQRRLRSIVFSVGSDRSRFTACASKNGQQGQSKTEE